MAAINRAASQLKVLQIIRPMQRHTLPLQQRLIRAKMLAVGSYGMRCNFMPQRISG